MSRTTLRWTRQHAGLYTAGDYVITRHGKCPGHIWTLDYAPTQARVVCATLYLAKAKAEAHRRESGVKP